ncbi:MAG: ABC transporter permease [Chloroflexi bacterium]|nr:ABC transporter permease [Chloroflexota bacterium]
MQRYIVRRLIQALIMLLVVSSIVFGLSRLTGNPVALLLTEYSSEQDKIELTKQLGFDKSIPEQYMIFISNALRGDLGRSIRGERAPAMTLVADRFPASAQLAVVTLIVSLSIGLPMGVVTALKKGSITDVLVRIIALIGQSAPVFWIGIVAMYFFSVQLRLLPSSGYGKPEQFVLPVFALTWFTLAAIVRLTRSSMIDSLDSEYIKLARIKGLSEWIVVWKHALRNSLLPVLTYSGIILGRTIAGVVVVETVFAWPGIGRLAYESVLGRDFPVLQAVVLVVAALFLLINLLVDVLYAYIDPRIRFS